MSFALPVPLLGRINAGLPSESMEYKEGEVFCDPSVLHGEDVKKFYALRVHGESMREIGIMDGDLVIVKHSDSVRRGNVVVALVNNETTVKSYYPNGKLVELRPANSEYKPQIYPAKEVKIQGSVIALQRRY
jgi:repressor LexA